MNDNLLELNGLKKFWKGRTVELKYEVPNTDGFCLGMELEEYVINNGFALYKWRLDYFIDDVTEYAISGSSAKGSDIYEEALQFFLFIRTMEHVPVDTWELVRMDINEFLGQFSKIALN